MDPLIIYIGEGVRFDRQQVRLALLDLPGRGALEERHGVGWLLQALVECDGDASIVRLVDDEETISLSGAGDASLRVAIELQARMQADLRIVDCGYTFDLSLRGLTTVEALRTAMAEARAAAAREPTGAP